MMQSMPLDIQAFPEEITSFLGNIHWLTFPPQGDTSAVVVVSTDRGIYVVKCSCGEQFSSWIEREHNALTALAQAPFPTPYPHVFIQREKAGEQEAWLVMSYLPGDPLIVAIEKEPDPEARRCILRAFGRALATIHQYAVEPALQSDRNLVGADETFLRYPTEGSVELLEHLKQHQLFPVAHTLIHGDFTVENVLISERRVTGIIDWAGGGIGDPRYDLALAIRPKKTGLFQVPQDRQAFFEGYSLSDLSEADYEYFAGLYAFF